MNTIGALQQSVRLRQAGTFVDDLLEFIQDPDIDVSHEQKDL